MSSDIEFTNISAEFKGSICTGKFKLTSNGISFKDAKTGKTEQISASDIELATWVRLISVYGLRVFLKNGALQRYFGFKDTDQEKIAKFFKNTYEQDVLEKELSIKGWNWGTAKFHGSVLTFEVNNLVDFDIPLNTVSQCTTGKNEVTLEFHQREDATPVNLMELRFHIPSSELAGAKDPVEAFHDQVMQKASVISVSGDAIAIFREMHCLTPRGRYDIKMFQSFFQLHGKTFDYKVPMSTVIRLFILPHKDGRQHFLVISLDPPIKQGQTRYHFLVLLFNQDEDSSIELPFSEEEIQEKFEGKITKELNGPTYQVLGKIMKVLVNRKITTPGNFKGISGTPAISCSYKAAAGYIYPLDRGFIYIHKPPIHIRFEEISSVNFARSGGSTRSFDFEIELKGGVVHTFSSIEKEEYGKLFEYIKQKDLKIKNVGKDKSQHGSGDFGDSDQEAAPDAYLERVKREGEERDEDEESEDSTDEDFNPSGADESDVAEEYDSNPTPTDTDTGSTTDESVSDLKKTVEKKPKKKEKKEKKEKKVSEKQRKRKKPRDENKPKRPPTAYMLWFNEMREKIKSDNPGISFTEIGKKGGELWKKITSSDKEEFEAKAAKAKEEYAIAMKAYQEKGVAVSEDDSGKETKKSKSQPKSNEIINTDDDTSTTSDNDD